MIGTVAENVVYDISMYVLIDPPAPGLDLGDHNAKVYLRLTTSEQHSVWLEGDGTLTLVEHWFDMEG